MESRPNLSSLQDQIVTIPGGYDRDGRSLLVVTVSTDAFSTVDVAPPLKYLLNVFSPSSRQRGLTVIVDARKGPWRAARSCIEQVSDTIPGTEIAQLLVLRPDAFWDKQRVENCTNVQYEGQVLFIPRSRLNKYVDQQHLPVELGGTFIYDHEQWLENRRRVDSFFNDTEAIIQQLDELTAFLEKCKSSKTDGQSLSTAREMSATTRMMVNSTVETGRDLLQTIEYDHRVRKFSSADISSHPTPQEVLDTFERIDELLAVIRRRQHEVEEAVAELELAVQQRFPQENTYLEMSALEEGVAQVVTWVLGRGEALLTDRWSVGWDVASCEELRREHQEVEMQCWDTYGAYAELLHKIEIRAKTETMSVQLKSLLSQKEFMDFLCRSFALRLERRRNVLITSLRFFRLVSEYFDKTGEVFDSLVMGNKQDNFPNAESKLKQLQESQNNLETVERELVKEGEKLSDMLSIPVKDTLGRDLPVDYAEDIANIRDILDATTARKNIFSDSLELQKLTLEQISHIACYERDSEQAIQWLEELYQVMVRDMDNVGTNVVEIQRQKEEHLLLQETSKDAYAYGTALLSAAASLRRSCRVPPAPSLQRQLEARWRRLHATSQEQVTRLRVAAVFHRSVSAQCHRLRELREAAATATAVEPAGRRDRVRRCAQERERLMVHVGRMVRLGRLLRSRLKEPLASVHVEVEEDDGECPVSQPVSPSPSPSLSASSSASTPELVAYSNEVAIEAVTERLQEVTTLAEELDQALQSAQQDCDLPVSALFYSSSSGSSIEEGADMSPPPMPPPPELKLPPGSGTSPTEDEFHTASDCTLQHSRSSSYNTASECEHRYSPWWETQETPRDQELHREKMVLAVGLPQLPDPGEVLKPPPEVPPGKIVRQVIETTHLKVQHQHSLGVASYVLTSETARERGDAAVPADEALQIREAGVPPEKLEEEIKEVSNEESGWICREVTKQAIRSFV